MPEVDEVLEKLGYLEKQNRRLKKAGILVMAIVVAALIMGQAASKARIINAEGFVLRDKNGIIRAELAAKTDGAVGLYLYNPQRLKHSKEADKAAGTKIKDPPDVSLEVSPYGSPSLTLGVESFGPTTQLYVMPGGVAGLSVSYKGKRVSLGVSAPKVFLSEDKRRVQLYYWGNEDKAYLYFHDVVDGKDRLLTGLGVAKQDADNPFFSANGV